ncbi:hypothetical protein VTN96DRAFT_4095 [Rasamsonia emersonii]
MGPVMCHEMGARTGRPAHPAEVKASYRRSTWLVLLPQLLHACSEPPYCYRSRSVAARLANGESAETRDLPCREVAE